MKKQADNVLEYLASAQNCRDEQANLAFAETLVMNTDSRAIQELVVHLQNSNKTVQSDCIKVLYEVGERKPELIASYLEHFVDLLQHNNNRLQWGAMTALACISRIEPEKLYAHLTKILQAAKFGSVITRDQTVNILIHLATVTAYHKEMSALLVEQLQICPANQVPMYAERMLPIVRISNNEAIQRALQGRLRDIDKESKRKRIEKVIKQIQAMSQ